MPEDLNKESALNINAAAPSKNSGGKRILIIDDDLQHLRVMSIILNKAGFTDIALADTGEKGLEVFEQVMPAVVILDTVLPKKDGFEVCSQIKGSRGNLTKVILNTGVIDSVNARKAKEAGADEYLPKTLGSKNIVEAVRKFIK